MEYNGHYYILNQTKLSQPDAIVCHTYIEKKTTDYIFILPYQNNNFWPLILINKTKNYRLYIEINRALRSS